MCCRYTYYIVLHAITFLCQFHKLVIMIVCFVKKGRWCEKESFQSLVILSMTSLLSHNCYSSTINKIDSDVKIHSNQLMSLCEENFSTEHFFTVVYKFLIVPQLLQLNVV